MSRLHTTLILDCTYSYSEARQYLGSSDVDTLNANYSAIADTLGIPCYLRVIDTGFGLLLSLRPPG